MKKRFKILQIIPTLHCGGAERFLIDLSNELASEHDVTVLCYNSIAETDFLPDELQKNIKIITLNCAESFWGACCAMPKVWRTIRREKPDAVHLHLGGLLAAGMAILSRIPSVPYIYTVHSDAFFDAGPYLLIKKLLFKLGRVYPVTISTETTESFLRAYKLRSTEIINGCRSVADRTVSSDVKSECESWRKTPQSKLLINLARIVPAKNQVTLASAVKKLTDDGVDLDVVIMGDEWDKEVVQKIRDVNCSRVHVVGRRNNPIPYLLEADGLCLPSEIEGMPITLLEAFSLGVPACVTPVGGMKNLVVDGENGLVAAGISSDQIADMLRRFCALSAEKTDYLRAGAEKSFEPYSMKICAQRYLELIGRIANGAEK